MELRIELNKEEVLKLLEKDEDFQVYIQKAALNYLRNCKLKPLMREEVVREIENYKRELRANVEHVLKELGFKESNWGGNSSIIGDKIKNSIREQVLTEMTKVIGNTVHEELNKAYQHLKCEISRWESAIKSLCEKSITPEKIKRIAQDVIEKKFSK